MQENIVKKGDFIEIKYSGYANGELFDSNVEEDFKKLNPKGKASKIIIVVGEKMVVGGLDKALEGKEIGREYKIEFGFKEGFGERKRELVKTIPLKAFREQNVNPRPGMVLTLDNFMVKIIAVSGARVVTDFNNPLAGKNLSYNIKILKRIKDEKEKTGSLFLYFWKFIPAFSIEKDQIIVQGQKEIEFYVKESLANFKRMLGKEIVFEEKLKEGLETKLEDKSDSEESKV